jgi:hypothetical protein
VMVEHAFIEHLKRWIDTSNRERSLQDLAVVPRREKEGMSVLLGQSDGRRNLKKLVTEIPIGS